jgi:hypothetical protein
MAIAASILRTVECAEAGSTATMGVSPNPSNVRLIGAFPFPP